MQELERKLKKAEKVAEKRKARTAANFFNKEQRDKVDIGFDEKLKKAGFLSDDDLNFDV